MNLIFGTLLLFFHHVGLHSEAFSDYISEPDSIESRIPRVLNAPNLEEEIDPFVLETKRIEIDGFPNAFNPSIIRWDGRLLMSFRTYHPETGATNEIGFVYLNDDFEPVGTPKLIQFLTKDPNCLSKQQDPRLFGIVGKLFLIYNNAIKDEVRRMLVARLEFDGETFVASEARGFFDFEGEKESRSEKNWVPFEYNHRLHLAYSLLPHKILAPIDGFSSCETISSTLSPIRWNWGVLRGGTPALLENGEYLAFFHSSKNMATEHSEGKTMLHYFLGAYTFSAKPPFAITKVSPKPIMGKDFYKGPSYKTWKPLRVVFPGGFISDEKFIWLLYGRQDHEVWVAKLDKRELLNSLVECSY
jgi:predicted GH43/DUF377 family glycosyl hydrolase